MWIYITGVADMSRLCMGTARYLIVMMEPIQRFVCMIASKTCVTASVYSNISLCFVIEFQVLSFKFTLKVHVLKMYNDDDYLW